MKANMAHGSPAFLPPITHQRRRVKRIIGEPLVEHVRPENQEVADLIGKWQALTGGNRRQVVAEDRWRGYRQEDRRGREGWSEETSNAAFTSTVHGTLAGYQLLTKHERRMGGILGITDSRHASEVPTYKASVDI